MKYDLDDISPPAHAYRRQQLEAVERMLLGWEYMIEHETMPGLYKAGLLDAVASIRFALETPWDSRTWPPERTA